MNEWLSRLENGFGLDVILWFQSWRDETVKTVFQVISFTGEEVFLIACMTLVYWCVDARLGRRLSIFMVFSAWINFWCKEWWQRPRPAAVSPEVHTADDWIRPASKGPTTSFGLPSGHAQAAMTLCGYLATHVRRWWFTLLMVVCILLVCMSRLVLGMHFPQDLIGGILLALLALLLFIWLEPKATRWLSAQSLSAQIAAILAAAAAMAVIHPVCFPPHLAKGIESAASMIGLFIGLGIGFALEVRYLGFAADGRWWQKTARFVPAFLVFFLLRFELLPLFRGMMPDSLFFLGRGCHSLLIGLYIAYLAPWIFVKCGLAKGKAN